MFNTHFPETLFDLKFLLLANSTHWEIIPQLDAR